MTDLSRYEKAKEKNYYKKNKKCKLIKITNKKIYVFIKKYLSNIFIYKNKKA